MNYLLYGPDTYRSRKKLRELIAEHRPKAGGGFHFYAFDAAVDDMGQFAATVAGGGLFAVKKLIVLDRAFTAGASFDVVLSVLTQTYKISDVLLVLWDEAPDVEGKKRMQRAEKYFDRVQEFAPLAGTALHAWIRKEALARGAALAPPDMSLLAASYAGDGWSTAQEIEKRALGGESGTGRRLPRFSIFDLGDTFFSSPVVARRVLFALLDAGESEMPMFAYLGGQLRKLLIIKIYSERGVSVPASANIKPFVIQKASRYIRTLSVDHLARLLSRFLEEDRRIKMGITTAQESLLRLLG